MSQCCWLINGNRCNNIANALVCESCYPEKRRLYHKYKSLEDKVINMLSHSNNNPNKLLKIIVRLQQVIDLRKEFTCRLDPAARDYGHKLHIRTLYCKVNEYKRMLQQLWMDNEFVLNDVEDIVEDDSCNGTINTCISEVKNIVKQIEEDPFSAYIEDIETNRSFEHLLNEFKGDIQTVTQFTDAQMHSMYCYILDLTVFVTMCFRRISTLLKGMKAVYTTRAGRKCNILDNAAVYLHNFVTAEFSSSIDAISWLKRIIPVVDNIVLDGKIERVGGKHLFIIKHIIKGSNEVRSLAVRWVGKDDYKFSEYN